MARKQSGDIKVLVSGDVNGNFKSLFSRVDKVNKKSGPFDMLLCVGNFFGASTSGDEWNNYKMGKKTAPIDTYILGPTDDSQMKFYPDMNGCEIAPKISYLGQRGVFSASEGLRIAYVSGVEGEGPGKFNAADVVRVRDSCVKGQPSYRGVDILLTSQWPHGVTQRDEKTQIEAPKGSELLSWLAVQIKPRYHFAGLGGIFYERPPYRNLDTGSDSGAHQTRFMALAPVGGGSTGGGRWLYAASLTPIEAMRSAELRQQTTDQTELPYSGAALASTPGGALGGDSQQYFFDMTPGKRKGEGGPREKRARPTFDQDTCWFCLASPQVEKHLVISIGEEVYLALAKGGLVEDNVMILPVTHHQCAAHVPDTVTKEIQRYQEALKKCFAKQGKVPVFFERNYKTSHLQIQVVPVPQEMGPKLKMVFQELAEAEGFTVDELPPHARLEQVIPPNTPYFYVELPDGERLFHRIKKNFPLYFGREVLASTELLDMEERADWKHCTVSKEEETKIALQFRAIFKPYDFTL